MRALLHRPTLALSGLLLAAQAQAHDGHGLQGSHWHATDSVGLIAVALGLAVGLWFTRK